MGLISLGFIYAIAAVSLLGVVGQWQARDEFDMIRLKMDKVTSDNCEIRSLDDLYLPDDVVSHKPDVKDINVNPVFPNRTALLHLHNLALSRSFFWSFILQSRYDVNSVIFNRFILVEIFIVL